MGISSRWRHYWDRRLKKGDIKLFCTLLASFPHFRRFAMDNRLAGIRLNSATVSTFELDKELRLQEEAHPEVPCWFDVKGRQPRIAEAWARAPDGDEMPIPEAHGGCNMVLRLNHPIQVETPLPVLFRAGADSCLLTDVADQGRTLVFEGGPGHIVHVGESLHLRHPSFRTIGKGGIFTDDEKEKIVTVRKTGMTRWFLSYVEEERDLDELMELTGKDIEIMLKIETVRGLEFVQRFSKRRYPNCTLVAACGDLYVEVDQPFDILKALPLIVQRDPEACVGSRILLSTFQEDVPSLADYCQLAWYYDLGYRNYLLCDEICLQEDTLAVAVNSIEGFRVARGIIPPDQAVFL